MKILFLGYTDSSLIDFLRNDGNEVVATSDEISDAWLIENNFDLLISYGYRYIISSSELQAVDYAAINLHISFLPFNRGADPNFWSFVEDSPKGVTIHLIDEGLDTGNIICQKEVELNDSMTLRESYAILQSAIIQLFRTNWSEWKTALPKGHKANGVGSYHNSADKNSLVDGIDNWLDIPIRELKGRMERRAN